MIRLRYRYKKGKRAAAKIINFRPHNLGLCASGQIDARIFMCEAILFEQYVSEPLRLKLPSLTFSWQLPDAGLEHGWKARNWHCSYKVQRRSTQLGIVMNKTVVLKIQLILILLQVAIHTRQIFSIWIRIQTRSQYGTEQNYYENF